MATICTDEPIFILGITPRSGTNFLWDLLCLHPDCAPPRAPIREDLFLANSDGLAGFVDSVRAAWDPAWGIPSDDLRDRFCASVGDGLIQFLRAEEGRRLVTKSPSVRNISRFFTFFPCARLLILVRDGRDVVSSCMQTFGWDFDRAARLWAASAEDIHRFDLTANDDQRQRYRIVRYEDVLSDFRGTLGEVFAFLGLQGSAFDFEAAEQLPVRGSSTFRGGSDRVHWSPLEKSQAFRPLHRWRSWRPDQHQRFAWLAGPQLAYFDYPLPEHSVHGRLPVATHVLRDWLWHGSRIGRRVSGGVQRRLARFELSGWRRVSPGRDN